MRIRAKWFLLGAAFGTVLVSLALSAALAAMEADEEQCEVDEMLGVRGVHRCGADR